ncbi:MAG: sigma-70 family RNA polymerase sigma factor [Deltaproteobacteria bacterium]|nr:sigma-70 family RNA polymerase sigma factor [Deltaproteobacteria bacterium]
MRADLVRYFRARVSDNDVAEDLAQDVLARVHRSLDGLRDERVLGPWVGRIARNRLTDHYRQKGRAQPAPPIDTPGEAESNDLDAELNRLVGGWLMAMIEHLPDGYRDALRLAEIEGLRQQEVADRLGLSLSGAKSRIQRGRQLLRRDLARCCEVEFDRRGNVVDIQPRGSTCC